MKSSRLLEMLLVLQTRGAVTAAELAQRLEVSTRTVYRDAEALGAAGVPVYAERGRGGGIRLLPGFRTDVTGLTQDEARALFVLTTGGAQADLGLGAALRSAVAKVLRAVPAPFQPAAAAASERILVDPAGWLRPADAAGELGVLQSAVFAGRRVRLGYRSSGSPQTADLVVDPYGLVCKAGVWYLVADCDAGPRLFRVSRVTAAAALDSPAVRADGATLASRWEQLRRLVDERPMPVQVLARVRRSRLDMFARIFSPHLDGPVPPAAPGSEWAEVTLRFPGVPAARTLLSFGADVEVTAPLSVRADLRSVALDVVGCYSAEG
jgi:predicted DNA-binding transcriptional regulator YafY